MKSVSKSAPAGTEERCHCGQLLARLTVDGIELKCRRCKRVHMLQWRKDCRLSSAQ
jgi:phage FluMu protein Com